MSGRGFRGRALVLSMQMQWQYQICPSKLPHGMAVTLTEETLRIMQDTVPLHQALSSPNAQHRSTSGLPTPGYNTYMEELPDLVPLTARDVCLGGLAAMVHANHLEGSFLDRRWRMGGLEKKGNTKSVGNFQPFHQPCYAEHESNQSIFSHVKRNYRLRIHCANIKQDFGFRFTNAMAVYPDSW